MSTPAQPARALGVAHLSALELAPPQWARLAARAGFASLGLRMHPVEPGALAWPLAAGSAAHREFAHVLDGEGIALHDVEFIAVRPELEPGAYAPMFEAAGALGARCVLVSGDDPDPARLAANLAALAALAEPYGLRIDLEFMRWRVIASLADACAAVARAAHPNLGVLVDARHLTRSGGTADAVRALPPGLVRAAQLCDAVAAPPLDDAAAILEARGGRLPPGEGALPLAALLRALPQDAALSVEMPMPALPTEARLALAYRSARRVVERADAAKVAEVPEVLEVLSRS